MTIEETKNRDEIVACFSTMAELRPPYDVESFTRQVRKQELKGYHLTRGLVDGEVVCVTGFWLRENLAWARKRECAELHLDSGVQRFGAHRFYLNHRMDITSHHFAIQL